MVSVSPAEQEQRVIEDHVVRIYRCATVVRGGRRFSFSALVVVGDRNSNVGLGYGKSVEVPSAVEKGKKIATREMVSIIGLQGQLRVHLKYGPRGEDVIRKLQRMSRPSCRIYRKVDELPKVLDGLGIAIVSTSKGVLSDRVCREQKVGGEVLCTVY